MTNELSALGAESAKNFVKGIPDAVKNLGLGLWEALNPVNFKNDLVSNKNTILEGSKIAFSSDLTTLMNRLYGQDVGDVQKALLVYSAVDAVRSSSGVGRLGNVVKKVSIAGDAANSTKSFRNLAPGEAIGDAVTFSVNQISKVSYSGRLNYVVKESGELVIGRTGHTSLSAGGNVLAAGEVRFVNGELRGINNASGHYRPSGSNAQNAAESAFQQAGFKSAGKYMEKY